MSSSRSGTKNSFHPGVLAIVLPALAGMFIGTFNPWNWRSQFENPLSAGVCLLLSAGLVVPWFFLQSRKASPALLRWFKELRPLIPGILLTISVPSLTLLGSGELQVLNQWTIPIYCVGCAVLSATVIGSEFDQKTMAGLLSQPQARGRIYFEKLMVLATALTVVATHLALMDSRTGESTAQIVWLTLIAFCSGPLFSLIGQGTLPSVAFSIAVPMVLFLAVNLVSAGLDRWLQPDETFARRLLNWVLVPYGIGTFLGGWFAFKKLEVRDQGLSRGTVLTHPGSNWLDRWLAAGLPGGYFGQLVRKEVRLHSGAWLTSSLWVVCWTLWMLAKRLSTDGPFPEELKSEATAEFMTMAGLGISGMTLLLAGCGCISEERQLGTLEWQLVQPVGIRPQWWIKLAVAAASAVILGLVVPLSLLAISPGLGGVVAGLADLKAMALPVVPAFLALIFVVGVYGSSFTRFSIKSGMAAIGLMIGLLLLWFARAATWEQVDLFPAGVQTMQQLVKAMGSPASEMMETLIIGSVAGAGLMGMVVLLLVLARRNLVQMTIPISRVAKQWALVFLAGFILGSFVFTFIEQSVQLRLAEKTASQPMSKLYGMNESTSQKPTGGTPRP